MTTLQVILLAVFINICLGIRAWALFKRERTKTEKFFCVTFFILVFIFINVLFIYLGLRI